MNKIITEKTNVFWAYVLFFIWPIFAVVQSFRNLNKPYAKLIIISFFGLFGFTLIYDMTDDSSRHEEQFRMICQKPFSDFFNVVSGLYSEEGRKPDFVMDLVAFIVSRFTENSHIFFLALGLMLGFVVMKNLTVLNRLYSQNKNSITLMFLIFFILLNNPGRILSVRHYVAMALYVYAVYQYFKENKSYYLILIATTVFIHFGFLMVVPLFFGFKIAGNRNKIYYVLIVLSFFFADITATLIRDFGVNLEGGMNSVVKGYTHQKYLAHVSDLQQQRNMILNNFQRWTTLYMFVALVFHKIRYKVFDAVSERLYSFCLLFFAFVNFTVGMESIANRFSIVFQVLCCYFFIHYYSVNKIKVNLIFKFTTLAFLTLNLVILARLLIEFTNFLMIVPFLPFALFMDSDVSILNMIK